jgi:hypothetical protein
MQNNEFFIPQIIWEKWTDPFGEDIEEAQWNDYGDEDGEISDQQEILKNKKMVKVISSPMGLIPYNEHTSSAKIFNFWVGHTNFNLSKGIASEIEKCNGVEILDIFTRYRFRVAVGKCFNDSDVMSEIKSLICAFLNVEDK